MIQAYFDDSKEAGKVLIYAGFISSTEKWSEFTDDWAELLSTEPTQNTFKMSRVRGVTAMRKAKLHYGLCQKHGLIAVGCAIPIEPLVKLVNEFSLPAYLTNPYFLAWRAAFTQCLMIMEQTGEWVPIEFIFDNQTERTKVLATWEEFINTASAKVRKVVKSAPSFRDDDDVIPLQAADMIAWWARKRWLEDKTDMLHLFPADWTAEYGDPAIHFAEMPEEMIRKQLMRDIEKSKAISAKAVFKNCRWT